MGNGQGQPTWALHIPSKLHYYTSKKQDGGYFCLRLYVQDCKQQKLFRSQTCSSNIATCYGMHVHCTIRKYQTTEQLLIILSLDVSAKIRPLKTECHKFQLIGTLDMSPDWTENAENTTNTFCNLFISSCCLRSLFRFSQHSIPKQSMVHTQIKLYDTDYERQILQLSLKLYQINQYSPSPTRYRYVILFLPSSKDAIPRKTYLCNF